MKQKTILVLANDDIGLFLFRRMLLERFISDGYQVVISIPKGEYIPKLTELGCAFIDTPMERRGMNPAKDIALYHRYLKILKETKPDLVVTYTIKPNIYGGMACQTMKVPYAANITGLGSAIEKGGVLRTLVLRMYRIGLRKAKVVFFENTGNRDTLVELGVVDRKKTYPLHGAGIDTEAFPYEPYPLDETVRFLFVGRVMREKGVEELFSAMERLRAKYGSKVTLDMIGYLEESYEQKIRELQTRSIVCFHGFQDDVKSYYCQSHCVVLPSYHEGMSNVLLEAGALGRPLITTNIPGCKEAVMDDMTGYLCQPRDESSLYDAMDRFVQLSVADKERMGKASHDFVVSVFDKRQVVEETVSQLY